MFYFLSNMSFILLRNCEFITQNRYVLVCGMSMTHCIVQYYLALGKNIPSFYMF